MLFNFTDFVKILEQKFILLKKNIETYLTWTLLKIFLETEEYAFDSKKISEWAKVKLGEANIHVVFKFTSKLHG